MARKKKKGGTPRKDDDRNESATEESLVDTSIDVLTARLSVAKSTSSKRPTISLCEVDAVKLNLCNNDEVLVLSTDRETSTLVGASVGPLHIVTGQSSPSKALAGRSSAALCPGIVQVPSTLADAILGNREFDNPNPVSTIQSPPATPSTTSGSFSFQDMVNNASTPTTKVATPLKSPSKQVSMPTVWIVPLACPLGRRLSAQLLSSSAATSTLHVSPVDHSNILKDTERIVLERLILAHTVGQWVQQGQRLRISFCGKALELVVDQVGGTAAASLTSGPKQQQLDESVQADFSRLSLQESPSLLSEEATMLLRALEASNLTRLLYKISYETMIQYRPREQKESDETSTLTSSEPSQPTQQQYVAGLKLTIEKVRSLLWTPLTRPELFAERGMKTPRGVLLHGPSGVGKTSLAKQLAQELTLLNCEVQYINCASLQSQTSIVGQAERQLTKLFRVQGDKSKLLIFDDIHLICPRRGGPTSQMTDRLAATLLALMDSVGSPSGTGHIVMLAITSNPSLLDSALRRPGRIDSEVEVPIPDDATTRAEIIEFQVKSLGASAPGLDNDKWTTLGSLAKGFNGADCMLAVKEAMRAVILRREGLLELSDGREDCDLLELTMDDLSAAIRATKPSAIKSVTVEIPKVHWTSIGGMTQVKQELRDAIELPQQKAAAFQQLGVPAPRGILLYGPPGCSKTLMARALATEGQMNFLAVKGPELLSKWLGESERALASLFRRARMASPSIIFFDEIDAIATKRGSGDSASGGRLLSQLLTELDGVTHTGNVSGGKQQRVVVVGATNRPDLLDTALTRPGRIDRMIYVGVPDSESRARIFEISLQDKAGGGDIDVESLARDDLTAGFSGAEIVAICRDAALLALEESDDPKAEATPKIGMHHMFTAIAGMQRQITPEMIEFYRNYREHSSA